MKAAVPDFKIETVQRVPAPTALAVSQRSPVKPRVRGITGVSPTEKEPRPLLLSVPV